MAEIFLQIKYLGKQFNKVHILKIMQQFQIKSVNCIVKASRSLMLLTFERYKQFIKMSKLKSVKK